MSSKGIYLAMFYNLNITMLREISCGKFRILLHQLRKLCGKIALY